MARITLNDLSPVIRLTLRTAMVGVVALALSGCHLSSNEAIPATMVRNASPCVHQFMVDYAKIHGSLLTYKKFGRAKYACRLLAKVQRKKHKYPADGCIGEVVSHELHATPAQRVSWLSYLSAIGFFSNSSAVGYEPSIHSLISWSSIKKSCRGEANTAAQVSALNMLKSTQKNVNHSPLTARRYRRNLRKQVPG